MLLFVLIHKKSIPEPFKIDSIFQKSIPNRRSSFSCVVCWVSWLHVLGRISFYWFFFQTSINNKKRINSKCQTSFSILRRIFEFKFWSWMVSYRTVITWKVLRNIWSFIISPLNPRKYCENGLPMSTTISPSFIKIGWKTKKFY